MKKINKISINTLLLMFDIPLLILLTKNLYTDIIYIYINIRIVIIAFIPIVLLFKILKTTIIIFKKSGLISSILPILRFEKSISDLANIFKDMIDIFMFYGECMLLLYLFMYSLDKTSYILESSNKLAIFLSVISLNIVLVLIRIYINKRFNSVTNIFQEKKNLPIKKKMLIFVLASFYYLFICY